MDEQVILVARTIWLHTQKVRTGVLDRVLVYILVMHSVSPKILRALWGPRRNGRINHVGGKPPFFDGTCYDYWKRKMKMNLGSINDQVWDVTKSDYVILDPTNLTKTRPTSNATQWLSTPSIIPLIPRCLSKSRIVRRLVPCRRDWRRPMRAHRL